jgi:hypothetical protein
MLDVFKVPTLSRQGVVKSLTAEPGERMGFIEETVYSLAKKLAPILRLNPFGRDELDEKLRSLDMHTTPEQYTAVAIIKAAFMLLFVIPALKIFPILALGVLVAAYIVYYSEKNEVDKLLGERRALVDREVPRFTRVLASNFEHNNKDIISFLEKYEATTTSSYFRREIGKTVADAKVSAPAEALVRFSGRIGSKFLSNVVTGVLGILDGNENLAYFYMLVADMRKEKYEMLKLEVLKRPEQLRKWTMMMVILFFASVFFVATSDLIRQAQMLNAA